MASLSPFKRGGEKASRMESPTRSSQHLETVKIINENDSKGSPRVARGANSPAPKLKVNQRTGNSKSPHPISSTLKTGAPAKLSLKLRSTATSPIRAPWGSPTAKASISRKVKTTDPKTTLRLPHSSPPAESATKHYAISDLLALRPDETSTRQRAPLFDLAERPVLKTEDVGRINTAQSKLNLDPLFYISPRVAAAASQQVEGLNPQLRVPVGGHRTIHILDTPTRQPGPSRKRNFDRGWQTRSNNEQNSHPSGADQPRWSKQSWSHEEVIMKSHDESNGQAAEIDNLTYRIRSALSKRGRRAHFGTPRNVQSVKWDPAVVEYGTIISNNKTDDRKAPLDTTVSDSTPGSLDADTKVVHCSGAEEDDSSTTKEQDKAFEYMKSISELKKGDRRKLFQLLEALRNIDSDNDSSNEDTVIIRKPQTARPSVVTSTAKSLNPKAPEFKKLPTTPPILRSYPDVLLGRPSLNIPRKRPRSDENYNESEPVWVKIKPNIPRVKQQLPYEHQTRLAQRLWDDGTNISMYGLYDQQAYDQGSQGFPAPYPFVQEPSYLPVDPEYWNLYAPQYVAPMTQPNPCVFYPPRNIRQFQATKNHMRVNPKLPVIDLTTGRIPSESGVGREVRVGSVSGKWSDSDWECFTKQFPLTGRLKASAPIPLKNRHATTIQQRLEYLLMEQKEKKHREFLEQGGSEAMPAKKPNASFHLEQKLLRQLYDECEQKDLVNTDGFSQGDSDRADQSQEPCDVW